MNAANQQQKSENYLNKVSGGSGNNNNNNIKDDEIYRMMLFLNLIKDESLSMPNIPFISEDEKPGKENDPFIRMPDVYPNIMCIN